MDSISENIQLRNHNSPELRTKLFREWQNLHETNKNFNRNIPGLRNRHRSLFTKG